MAGFLSRLDRTAFVRPIAHRGLHDPTRGLIENTAPAFEAAFRLGTGIECDLRPAKGGWPVVFHDETLDRLIDGTGPVAGLAPADLSRLRYKGQDTPILSFADLLDLAAGRGPLLVEVKSEWDPPDPDFLGLVASLASAYRGPLALMSFDPAVMAAFVTLAPRIPRGIVSGIYPATGAWDAKLDNARKDRLSHLLESAPAEPDFYAYSVKNLPTPATRYAREVHRMPIFTWTVRTADDWAVARDHADAAIFEGEPRG